MKKQMFTGFLMAMVTMLIGQGSMNVELVSTYKRNTNEEYNDIWGYVDGNNVEYAILGAEDGTSIVSLTIPTNPKEVAYIPGAKSIWRDMKSNGDYVYVTTDQGQDGLLIINMSGAPDNITWDFWRPQLQVGNSLGFLNQCHNIYIDNGHAYLSGCNLGNEGVIILDITTDPENPVMVGVEDARYSHDVYVRGDLMYSSDIRDGFFSIWDISDKSGPVELAQQNTSFTFTHNTWLSDDGNYLFTTDERGNAYVDAWDVSDFQNIKFLDRYRPPETEGNGVIPHNTHYHNGFLVTSWYTDGVQILDATHPEKLVRVGYYDTCIDFDNGFNGAWGAYPFLPSGLLLVSDIQDGLYVLDPNYVNASFLQGNVTDAATGDPLFNAQITIQGQDEAAVSTNISGLYKTGLATVGTFEVTAHVPGYDPQTKTVALDQGIITELDFNLGTLPSFPVSAQVMDAVTGLPIENAVVIVRNDDFTFEELTDANGDIQLSNVFQGNYEVIAGKWGYQETLILDQNVDGNLTTTVNLEPGYKDDFILDQGWTEDHDAVRGAFVLDEPIGTIFGIEQVSPEEDIPDDLGDMCYITRNNSNSAVSSDLDNGFAMISSPEFDLTSYAEPMLSYYIWFVNTAGDGAPNDAMEVRLSNGVETVVLEHRDSSDSKSVWTYSLFEDLSTLIDITANMQLHVIGVDTGVQHLVEVGFDGFLIEEGLVDGIQSGTDTNIDVVISPNPSHDRFELQVLENDVDRLNVDVYDQLGQKVESFTVFNDGSRYLFGNHYAPGLYAISLYDETGKWVGAQKLIKQ